MWLRIFFLLLVSCFAQGEVLTWDIVPLPGVAEVDRTGETHRGAIFDLLAVIERENPQFQYEYRIASPSRILSDFKLERPICAVFSVRSAERDEYASFVTAFAVVPLQLVIRKDDLVFISKQEDGSVSFAKLVQNSQLRGVTALGRGFPMALMGYVEKGLQEGTISQVGSASGGVNVLSMIAYGRYDYTLEFPMIANPIARKLPMDKQLVMLPIEEAKEVVPVGIYCSKGAWGESVLPSLEKSLRHINANWPLMRKLYIASVGSDIFEYYEKALYRFNENLLKGGVQ